MAQAAREPGYAARHYRVKKLRGKAAEYACVDCGGPATDWATIHGTDGSDPFSHYQPMCHPDHNRYDLCGRVNGPLSEELKSKISASQKAYYSNPVNRARIRTATKQAMARPEVREKLTAAIRQFSSDPEYQARQHIAQKKAWDDPQRRARHSAIMTAAHASSESRAVISAAVKAANTPVPCEFCDRQISNPGNMTQHIRARHPEAEAA